MAQSDNEPADDDDHDGSTATGRAITAAQTCVVSWPTTKPATSAPALARRCEVKSGP